MVIPEKPSPLSSRERVVLTGIASKMNAGDPVSCHIVLEDRIIFGFERVNITTIAPVDWIRILCLNFNGNIIWNEIVNTYGNPGFDYMTLTKNQLVFATNLVGPHKSKLGGVLYCPTTGKKMGRADNQDIDPNLPSYGY